MASLARPYVNRAIHLTISPRPRDLAESREVHRLVTRLFGEVEHYESFIWSSPQIPQAALCIFKDEDSARQCLRTSPIRFQMGKKGIAKEVEETRARRDRHGDGGSSNGAGPDEEYYQDARRMIDDNDYNDLNAEAQHYPPPPTPRLQARPPPPSPPPPPQERDPDTPIYHAPSSQPVNRRSAPKSPWGISRSFHTSASALFPGVGPTFGKRPEFRDILERPFRENRIPIPPKDKPMPSRNHEGMDSRPYDPSTSSSGSFDGHNDGSETSGGSSYSPFTAPSPSEADPTNPNLNDGEPVLTSGDRLYQILAHPSTRNFRDVVNVSQHHGFYPVDTNNPAQADLKRHVPQLGLSDINWRASVKPFRFVGLERKGDWKDTKVELRDKKGNVLGTQTVRFGKGLMELWDEGEDRRRREDDAAAAAGGALMGAGDEVGARTSSAPDGAIPGAIDGAATGATAGATDGAPDVATDGATAGTTESSSNPLADLGVGKEESSNEMALDRDRQAAERKMEAGQAKSQYELSGEARADADIPAEDLSKRSVAQNERENERQAFVELLREMNADQGPAEEKAAEEQIAGEMIAEEKVAEEKVAEEKVAEEKVAGEKIPEGKVATEQGLEKKTAEERKGEEKTAKEKSADQPPSVWSRFNLFR